MELLFAIGGVILANYILGVVKSLGIDFSTSRAVMGLLEVFKKVVAVSAIYFAYFYLQGIPTLGDVFTPLAWAVLGLIGLYHLNSGLLNATKMAGIEKLVILDDFDAYVKKLMGKSNPSLIPQLSEVDLTIESAHLLQEEE